MLRTIWRSCAVAVFLLIVSSCKDDEADAGRVEALSFPSSSATLNVGDTLRMVPGYVTTTGGAIVGTPAVEYTSSNPAVATVEAKGSNYAMVITAVGAGTSTITATCCGSIHATIAVTVTGGTWVLDSITGASSATWTENGGTMSGVLQFNVPQQVSAGESYPISVTFAATLTSNSGAALRWNIDSYVTDLSRNLSAPYDKFDGKFINANPSVTDSITTTWLWPVSAAVHGNLPTLILQARGDGSQGPPTTILRRTAYYHKVMP